MNHLPHVYTVESVTSGHPDKVCDQISDAVLDACLEQDPMTRAGIECFGSHGHLVIGGEVTTKAQVNYEQIARDLYKAIGYDQEIEIRTHIAEQSPDIAQGVDTGGAGDQGIMYGYATAETPEYLPAGIVLVHRLTKALENVRKSGLLPWLGPDGKAQVTIIDNKLRTVLVSAQHQEKISHEDLSRAIRALVVEPLVGDIDNLEILVNPTGSFVRGGFEADAGLTGRKIMVDTYGGLITHGGGCFSGKDPSKVDRSAAYMARFVAKNLVAAGLARECLVSVAYAIGQAEPLMVYAVDEQGRDLSDTVREHFDFKPKAIIERLGLRRPIYSQTAAYGHFGKSGLPWEEIISQDFI
ncbi:MAG: methionine adenosyltransferase [Candidatus Komeilibacteria bacterium]|nr:methionine adenosyltransferase [Candidatus Komeilibacteria bacterium]